MSERLHYPDLAARLGVKEDALRQRMRRGTLPAPDGYERGAGGISRPWWHESTIAAHEARHGVPERRGPGRPRKEES